MRGRRHPGAFVGECLAAMEWIRVWAHEVSVYQRKGWRLCSVRRGMPSEVLMGLDYADCLMVREVKADA